MLSGIAPQAASEAKRSCRKTGRCLIRRLGFIVFSKGSRQRSAFTLVEVVIAVGLVGFVLTAILGLAALAANETKNADLKARLAWITESTTSEYQSQRFSTALGNLPSTNYRDFSGLPVADPKDAYFRCDVVNVTPPAAPPKFTAKNFALLQLTIRWPVNTKTQVNWPDPSLTSPKNVSLISLFNYQ